MSDDVATLNNLRLAIIILIGMLVLLCVVNVAVQVKVGTKQTQLIFVIVFTITLLVTLLLFMIRDLYFTDERVKKATMVVFNITYCWSLGLQQFTMYHYLYVLLLKLSSIVKFIPFQPCIAPSRTKNYWFYYYVAVVLLTLPQAVLVGFYGYYFGEKLSIAYSTTTALYDAYILFYLITASRLLYKNIRKMSKSIGVLNVVMVSMQVIHNLQYVFFDVIVNQVNKYLPSKVGFVYVSLDLVQIIVQFVIQVCIGCLNLILKSALRKIEQQSIGKSATRNYL